MTPYSLTESTGLRNQQTGSAWLPAAASNNAAANLSKSACSQQAKELLTIAVEFAYMP